VLYFAFTVHFFEISITLPTDVLCLKLILAQGTNAENRATCQSLRPPSLAPLAGTRVYPGYEAKSWVSPASGDCDCGIYNPLT